MENILTCQSDMFSSIGPNLDLISDNKLKKKCEGKMSKYFTYSLRGTIYCRVLWVPMQGTNQRTPTANVPQPFL